MNILITGANRGLGLEMAKQSIASGHTVYATARAIANGCDTLLVDLADDVPNTLGVPTPQGPGN